MEPRFTSYDYHTSDEDKKNFIIDEIFKYYRENDLWPYKSELTEESIEGVVNECLEYSPEFDGDVLSVSSSLGNDLCCHFNSHIYKCNTKNGRSLYNRFYTDDVLKKCIKLGFNIKKNYPDEVFDKRALVSGLGMYYAYPTNFPAMKAKALYEHYCPRGGVIYDSSAGWGGRLLGALSSKNDYKYIANEPSTKTVEGLNNLGRAIESVTGRLGSYKIIPRGSEHRLNKEEFVDFYFTSPPYFDYERYSEEETQSCVKYPTLGSWEILFMRPTIENTYAYLKQGAYYAINIADYGQGVQRVNFVDDWLDYCSKVGLQYVKTIAMNYSSRQSLSSDSGRRTEAIYLFRKQ